MLILAWVAVWNYDPYKFRFENMDAYYNGDALVALKSRLRDFRNEAQPEVLVGTRISLVSNETARTNWLAHTSKLIPEASSGNSAPRRIEETQARRRGRQRRGDPGRLLGRSRP